MMLNLKFPFGKKRNQVHEEEIGDDLQEETEARDELEGSPDGVDLAGEDAEREVEEEDYLEESDSEGAGRKIFGMKPLVFAGVATFFVVSAGGYGAYSHFAGASTDDLGPMGSRKPMPLVADGGAPVQAPRPVVVKKDQAQLPISVAANTESPVSAGTPVVPVSQEKRPAPPDVSPIPGGQADKTPAPAPVEKTIPVAAQPASTVRALMASPEKATAKSPLPVLSPTSGPTVPVPNPATPVAAVPGATQVLAPTPETKSAIAAGKELFELEYALKKRKLEAAIADLDAKMAESRAKSNPIPIPAPVMEAPKSKKEDRHIDFEELLSGLGDGGSVGGPSGSSSKGGLRRPTVSAVSNGSAIVNGNVVHIGSAVGGFRVTKINPGKGSVTLSSKNYGTIEISI